MAKGFLWQCKCGHMEYLNEPPEDCQKCLRVGKFVRIPEDMIEEKEEESILSMHGDEESEGEEYED